MSTANESGKSPERATDAFPKWVWLVGAGALLVIGWAFILFQNNLRITAPVVMACLGYGAGVAAVYTLFRMGSAAASGGEDEGGGWGRPVGERSELEREKKALLKAIKEAEFDLQMGKLSRADGEAMIAGYRAQAIAVIRELDREESAEASAREQIEREVRARIEVANAKQAPDADRRPQGKKGKKQPAAAKVEPAAAKVEEAATKVEAAATKAEPAAAKVEPAAAKAEPAAAKVEEAAEAAASDEQAEKIDQPDGDTAAKAEEAAASAGSAAVDPSNAEARGNAGAGAAKEATS